MWSCTWMQLCSSEIGCVTVLVHVQKKQRAEKRRADSSSERSSFKQRRLEEVQSGAQVSAEGCRCDEIKTSTVSFLSAVVFNVFLFFAFLTAHRQTGRRRSASQTQERAALRHPLCSNTTQRSQRSTGRNLLLHQADNSSLQACWRFPPLPPSAAVSQVKEKIFTSDSFSDMDLHPHLVPPTPHPLPHSLWQTLTGFLNTQKDCLWKKKFERNLSIRWQHWTRSWTYRQ